jgi:hypothetical protein
VRAHDAEDRGEAEPAAERAGGEEGVEDLGERRLRHADAGVRDLDEHEVARGDLGAEPAVGEALGVDRRHAGVQGRAARSALERAAGVREQVHHHLLELDGVRRDGRQRRGERLLERGAAGRPRE